MQNIIKTVIIATAMFATPVYAGSWAVGYGIMVNNSPKAMQAAVDSATSNSLKAAESAVRSRGSGCVGRNESGDDTKMEVDGNVVKVYTFYSHHNGSCGR